jgi:threonine synthase
MDLATVSTHDRGVIARWRAFLPAVTDATPVISLNEGSTPLIFSPRLSERVGRGAQVYLKYEGLNPTGSFKDRGMTVAVSKAMEEGVRAIVCASTGNTSAAAAAYAARAGLACVVLLPAGKIALGKLVQAMVYGAKIVSIKGNFDDALRLVRDIGSDPGAGMAIVNSINPHRLEGQKTAAFEIIDELGDAPNAHYLPVGNAGNITAYWRGYREWFILGRTSREPRMTGFQAAGAAPIFHGRPVARPNTVASAIRIGNPASWKLATQAVTDSGGAIDIVTDDEILDAQSWLARNEGIFVEPASAASVAGLLGCVRRGGNNTRCADCPLKALPEGGTVVCTVTGHGLKDTAAVLDRAEPLAKPVPATREAIVKALEND